MSLSLHYTFLSCSMKLSPKASVNIAEMFLKDGDFFAYSISLRHLKNVKGIFFQKIFLYIKYSIMFTFPKLRIGFHFVSWFRIPMTSIHGKMINPQISFIYRFSLCLCLPSSLSPLFSVFKLLLKKWFVCLLKLSSVWSFNSILMVTFILCISISLCSKLAICGDSRRLFFFAQTTS